MAQFFIPKVGERRMTVRAALSLWTTGDALSSVATPLAHCRKNSNHYRVTAVRRRATASSRACTRCDFVPLGLRWMRVSSERW
jgi:hypothetical protein